MASPVTIGGNGSLFIGEDKTFRLFLYDRVVTNVASYSVANLPLDASGAVVIPRDANNVAAVPVDMTGWAVRIVVRKKDNTADPALIDKLTTIAGVYNVDPTINTQHAQAVCTDTELGLTKFPKADTYRHSWKRTDDGSETVLAYTDWVIERTTQV